MCVCPHAGCAEAAVCILQCHRRQWLCPAWLLFPGTPRGTRGLPRVSDRVGTAGGTAGLAQDVGRPAKLLHVHHSLCGLTIAKYTRVRNSVHLVKGLQDSIPLTRPFSAPVPTLTPWPD